MMRRPSAIIPFVLALLALGAITAHLALVGAKPQRDEGAAAHAWQLLMAAEVPAIVYFALTAVPQQPRRGLAILGLQVLAVGAAAAPVFVLHW
jgi:tryptophan-rich sensory protein